MTKAYLTRVGAGPFPSEAEPEQAAVLRDQGAEYGTVTGRDRRCGWLDLVGLRYAARVNGLTSLAVTKLDVLSLFDRDPRLHRLPAAGRHRHRRVPDPPVGLPPRPAGVQVLPGWQRRHLGRQPIWPICPANARRYLEFVEEQPRRAGGAGRRRSTPRPDDQRARGAAGGLRRAPTLLAEVEPQQAFGASTSINCWAGPKASHECPRQPLYARIRSPCGSHGGSATTSAPTHSPNTSTSTRAPTSASTGR